MAQDSKPRRLASVAVGTLVVTAALGTGAYALWSDSNLVDGAAIETGDLDIASSAFTAQDITPDRADGPHLIDLATWRAVPGDVVQLGYDLDLELRGDNLVAELVPAALENALELDPAAADYITVDVALIDPDGQTLIAGVDGRYLFQSDGRGQQDGADDENAVIVDSTRVGTDVTALVTVFFDESTPARVLANAELYRAMTDGAIELNQVTARTGR